MMLTYPFDKEALARLRAGDKALICGTLYTARDAAHRRMIEALDGGGELPIPIEVAGIYYVGPCVSGDKVLSAGPTTSYRMDAYAPRLYELGMRFSIGKGDRSPQVYEAIKRCGGVYFAAIGGAGALYADKILSSELVAYPDLGTEAIRRFEVKDFPVICAIDALGNSIYR